MSPSLLFPLSQHFLLPLFYFAPVNSTFSSSSHGISLSLLLLLLLLILHLFFLERLNKRRGVMCLGSIRVFLNAASRQGGKYFTLNICRQTLKSVTSSRYPEVCLLRSAVTLLAGICRLRSTFRGAGEGRKQK